MFGLVNEGRINLKISISDEPILVGRERELKQLEHYMNSAVAGEGTTVLVSGEAGSGKTRLANEFLNMAKKKDITVISGWCLSNAAVPYFPFIEAFGGYSFGNEPNNSRQLEIVTWLQGTHKTEKQNMPEIVYAQAWKDQTFAAVVKELLFLSTKKPVILFIDDIHWADSASLALLHYIARSIGSERILALATFRSEETLVKQTEGQPHPLIETLRLMGREGIFNEFALPGLSKVDVGKIAQNMLGGRVDTSLVEQLTEDSRGNPLAIVEYLRMMFEQGSLTKDHDQWAVKVDKVGIPSKVKEVIKRRLDALKPLQRRVLDAASVLGEKFNPNLVAEVVSQQDLDVIETLNTMEQCGRLVLWEGNSYRFDHAKTREMLYEEIPPAMKKAYHLKIAQRMEAHNQEAKGFPSSDIAHHFVQAGDKEKSIKYSLTAGKDALARFSNAEAIKYFTYVLENLPKDEEYTKDKLAAMEALGDAYYASMMFKEAAKTYEALSNLDGANRLRALRKAMETAFFQNDLHHLEVLLKEAETCKFSDRLENARVLMNKDRILTLQGRLPDEATNQLGIENARKALQVFEEEYSLWDAAWCLIHLGSKLPQSGQLEEGLAALFRAIALFRELRDTRWLIEAANYAGMYTALYAGSMQKGRELLEMAAEINENEKICDYLRLSQSNTMLGWIYSASGDLQGAVSKSLKALSYAERTDSFWAQGTAYSNLTTYYAMLGDNKKTEEFYGKLIKLPPEVHLNPMVNAPLATAYFLANKNQWEQSTQIVTSILEHFKTKPNPGLEATIKMSYAWILAKQGNYEKAKMQVEEANSYYQNMAKKFERINIYANLMAPINVPINQILEVRLDLINVSTKKGSLIGVEGIIPPELKVITMSKGSYIQDGLVKFKDNRLEPFEVSTLKLSFQAPSAGTFALMPQVRYVSDEEEESKTSEPKPITINIITPHLNESENTNQIEPQIKFKSDTSRQIFGYLVSAFNDDHTRRRFTQEQSGWRTLMEIAKEAKVSKNRLYRSPGQHGSAIAELELQEIVETRLFQGERGRGGKITKVRVAYEKTNVRREIYQETR